MQTETTMTADEARAEITAQLSDAGIKYTATLTQRDHNRDGWTCDAWRIVFTKPGHVYALDYYTGTGHRTPAPYSGAPYTPGTIAHAEWLKLAKCNAPHPADVLYSVTMDDTRGEDFEDWAEGLGYDTDSRKALAIYEQCQRQTKAARLFFGRDVLAQIAETLADY